MERLKAAIFDLDGLMVDSEPLQWRAMNLALSPLGIQIDESEWISMVGRRTIDNLARLRERHGFDIDPEEIEGAKNQTYRSLIRQGVIPMPGLHHAIDICSRGGLDLGLASSSVRTDVEIILRSLGLNGVFHSVVTGDDVPIGKPDPAIFLEAARRLSVSPSKCIVLEDTAYGVAAAKAAGMLCVAVPNRFTTHQDFRRADLVLRALTELSVSTLKSVQDATEDREEGSPAGRLT
jgi:HAD superfamily hydrolase (TIGR01509 family)